MFLTQSIGADMAGERKKGGLRGRPWGEGGSMILFFCAVNPGV